MTDLIVVWKCHGCKTPCCITQHFTGHGDIKGSVTICRPFPVKKGSCITPIVGRTAKWKFDEIISQEMKESEIERISNIARNYGA